MKLETERFGLVEAEVHICPQSAVNAYITSAYAYDLEGNQAELGDAQLDYLNDEYSAEVQAYAWESGQTRNHN